MSCCLWLAAKGMCDPGKDGRSPGEVLETLDCRPSEPSLPRVPLRSYERNERFSCEFSVA